MKPYRLIGTHAEDLGDGRTAEVGQVVELSAEDFDRPEIIRLVEEELLIEVPEKEKETPKKKAPAKQPAKKQGDDK